MTALKFFAAIGAIELAAIGGMAQTLTQAAFVCGLACMLINLALDVQRWRNNG